MRREVPMYDELITGDKVKNKYQFILAVAKRARMLVDGAPVASGIAGAKPTTRALGEIITGRIGYTFGKETTEEK